MHCAIVHALAEKHYELFWEVFKIFLGRTLLKSTTEGASANFAKRKETERNPWEKDLQICQMKVDLLPPPHAGSVTSNE